MSTPAPCEHEPAGPPGEEFWERYNKRLEFPLATVAAVLLHVLVGALLVFVLVRLMAPGGDRSSIPLVLLNSDGDDDRGSGAPGSGGENEAVLTPQNDPFEPKNPTTQTPALPQPTNPNATADLPDPTGALPPPTPAAPPRRAEKGEGPGPGKGTDGTKGPGPGGTGADSTRARSQRWTIRFRTADARDYIAQLRVLGGELLVPVPGEEGKFYYFPDLADPSNRRIATDADKAKLARQVRFCDTRPESVREVARALGLDFTPKEFWAFFPKGVEDQMERKERSYANRRPEQIDRTYFRAVIRGNDYDLVVDEQQPKK